MNFHTSGRFPSIQVDYTDLSSTEAWIELYAQTRAESLEFMKIRQDFHPDMAVLNHRTLLKLITARPVSSPPGAHARSLAELTRSPCEVADQEPMRGSWQS